MQRKLLSTSLVVAAMALTLSASAKNRGFSSDITGSITTPVKIEVTLSEDLAFRADNLPEKLKDRGSGFRRLNSGFANNGFYGQKDLDRLTERLQRKVETRFTKKGIDISDSAPTTLRLVITDAKPNRPTFKQLSKETSLSAFSRSLGGAEIDGTLIGPGGQDIGTVSYKYFETDFFRRTGGVGIWSDAHIAIDRFSRRLTKFLNTQAAPQ